MADLPRRLGGGSMTIKCNNRASPPSLVVWEVAYMNLFFQRECPNNEKVEEIKI
ncbi:unnamed protein product [Camellia sinensis]